MSARQREFFAWAAVGSAVVIGIVVFVGGYDNARDLPPGPSATLSADAARAGLQLAVIGVGGAVVAALFRFIDANREERRRVREYLLETLGEARTAYNGVKAARRRLRAT